jgi:hypothetical protein
MHDNHYQPLILGIEIKIAQIEALFVAFLKNNPIINTARIP